MGGGPFDHRMIAEIKRPLPARLTSAAILRFPHEVTAAWQ